MKTFKFSLGRVFDRSGAGFWGRLQVFPADVGDWFQRFCFYEKRRQLSFFTINHKVKATGFQPVSFSLAASLGFDEQAICEDAAFPTRGA